ncbi:MAG: DEAD/DEAH box helicase [Bacteroidales bacterium]|nr:DEAD/DEAH box helicase [Bacteroidales bacterium]
MTFSELRISTPLLNALEDLEFVYPTAIQHKCFRRITSGIDVVGIAQTGTGKTFAYLLPILNQLDFSSQKHPRVIIIVPTRELVVQVQKEVEKLSKYKNLRIKAVYGGANINTQKEYIYKGGLDILIGTPGRIYDIALSGLLRFSSIKKLVIDEVDEMLNLGFRPQIEQIMAMLPTKRQNLMFSSTLSEDVKLFISNFFYNPEIIQVDNPNTPVEKIVQKVYFVPNFNTKLNFLKNLIENSEEFVKNIVFVANKKQADIIYEKLSENENTEIGVIHSNKSQNFRFNVIKSFEKSKIRTLVATDVVARGLDFNDISHVISFSPPENAADYIHRIGRTGRAEKEGNSIMFVSPYEETGYIEVKKIAGKNFYEEEIPSTIPISKILVEDEKPAINQKLIVKTPGLKNSGGAYHNKSEKKLKENSGGLKRKRKAKIKKRSGKK